MLPGNCMGDSKALPPCIWGRILWLLFLEGFNLALNTQKFYMAIKMHSSLTSTGMQEA